MLQTNMNWDNAPLNRICHSFFEQDEREELKKVVEENIFSSGNELEDFITTANLAYDALPRRIRQHLLEFKRFSNSIGGLLVSGLPTDPKLPFTPTEHSLSVPSITIFSEFLLILFSTPFGEPFGYAQEKGGRLFHHVFPTQNKENTRSSESSKLELGFHTENTFHPYAPDYIFLYCLRQDVEGVAQTKLAGIQKIFPFLTEEDRELLHQPVFETRVFGNFATKEGQMITLSVLYGNKQLPYFRYDKFMRGKTPEAARVLDKVAYLVDQESYPFCLQEGNLLIIDNKATVHARTSFPAYYNGKDRWLQRLLVTSNLAASAQDRYLHDRIIHTAFNGF
jgi:hypothetical protein